MSRAFRQSVRLEGGRADGREIDVLPTQRIATVIVSETPHVYPIGVFHDDFEVTVTRVEIETYRREDDGVFRPYWTQTSIGDFAAREAV